MEHIYLVKYSVGEYSDYYTVTVFATHSINKAKKYVSRFNKLLKKWNQYYSQFEDNSRGINWIKDEYANTHFDRWNQIRNTNKCFYDKLEIR